MGFFDSILSVLTGGVSDLVQGNPFGSGMVNAWNEVVPEYTFLGKVGPSLFNPIGSANRDIDRRWKQGGSAIDVFSDTFERLADPTNSVNYSLGKFGQAMPESVRSVMPAVGAAIGTIAYPVAGTALGYGIGSHLRGDSSTQALTGSGLSATAAWAGGVGADQIAGATGSQAAGKLAGNLAQNAIKIGGNVLQNAIATHPTEIRQAYLDLKPYERTALFNSQYGQLATDQPDSRSMDAKTKTPVFEKTAVPELSETPDNKEKKIAEALTDEYKNYKLNDYMLYKQDPDKLKEILLKYGDN